jgi:hypothetical protein
MPRFTSALATAVVASSSAVAAAGPCESPEHRQFDFWLGQWEVRTPDGKLAGVNTIEREYDGCVVHERYANERGYKGESLNTYDAGRKVWHQTWVDNQGTLLLLEGSLQGASMVLQSETVGKDGRAVKHRITWTPSSAGSVRQHWESTNEQGQWATVFNGLYTHK